MIVRPMTHWIVRFHRENSLYPRSWLSLYVQPPMRIWSRRLISDRFESLMNMHFGCRSKVFPMKTNMKECNRVTGLPTELRVWDRQGSTWAPQTAELRA